MAKATNKLPIIIECFEKDALVKFSTLSDLPLIYLMFRDNPEFPNTNYDLSEITKFAHGVGPNY